MVDMFEERTLIMQVLKIMYDPKQSYIQQLHNEHTGVQVDILSFEKYGLRYRPWFGSEQNKSLKLQEYLRRNVDRVIDKAEKDGYVTTFSSGAGNRQVLPTPQGIYFTYPQNFILAVLGKWNPVITLFVSFFAGALGSLVVDVVKKFFGPG